MIQTGFGKLDDVLGGGIRNGTITDIFGASSTGKTQLTLQIVTNLISHGGTAFYQDTTGSFRPERLVEMLKTKGLDSSLLDKVTVGRITNTAEQLNNISKINESNFSLVVIDNVTDLFSFEYSKEDQILEKTNQFAKYMKQLSQTALNKKIPIVVVNMMRKTADAEQENLDPLISIFTHVKIKLSKKSTSYECEIFNGLKKDQFLYKITKEGLVELT
ncbi:MAG: ATPase domain-containing protein [Candidatus Nitrosotenuis sp.]